MGMKMNRSRWLQALGITLLLLLTLVPMVVAQEKSAAPARWMAPESVYMRIRANGADLDGDGHAPAADGAGAIAVLMFEQSVITAREAGSGMATGRRQYQPLLIRKRIDKSSPLLMRALTNNEVVEATFQFYRPSPTGDGTTEQYYTVALRNARVASYRIVAGAAGEPPTEEITFVFHTITWTYEDGGVTHEDTWDQQR